MKNKKIVKKKTVSGKRCVRHSSNRIWKELDLSTFSKVNYPGGYFEFVVGVCRHPIPPISDQNMSFSIPVFRPGLENPYPFLDLTYMFTKA